VAPRRSAKIETLLRALSTLLPVLFNSSASPLCSGGGRPRPPPPERGADHRAGRDAVAFGCQRLPCLSECTLTIQSIAAMHRATVPGCLLKTWRSECGREKVVKTSDFRNWTAISELVTARQQNEFSTFTVHQLLW